jgi:hypothetical protein
VIAALVDRGVLCMHRTRGRITDRTSISRNAFIVHPFIVVFYAPEPEPAPGFHIAFH